MMEYESENMERRLSGEQRTAILTPYLASAWRNIHHHDQTRFLLLMLYFVLAALMLALLWLGPRGMPVVSLSATLLLLVYGLLVIRTSVRFKERILRDMRVIYRINDLLFEEDDGLKQLETLFKRYRNPKGKASIRSRLSTTRHYMVVLSLVSSALVGLWAYLYTGPLYVIALLLGGLAIHVVFIIFVERGVAFDV